MAKKQPVCCCPACKGSRYWGIFLLVVAFLYLLQDYYIINWWMISPWTIIFLLAAFYFLCSNK